MQILKQNVCGKDIVRIGTDNGIDWSDELMLEFTFSNEWDGMVKVVSFTRGDQEFEPQVLRNGTTCVVPKEVMDGNWFRYQILGKRGNERMTTNTYILM